MNYEERDRLLKKERKRFKAWIIVMLIISAAIITASFIFKVDWLRKISYGPALILVIRSLFSYALVLKIRQDAEDSYAKSRAKKRH